MSDNKQKCLVSSVRRKTNGLFARACADPLVPVCWTRTLRMGPSSGGCWRRLVSPPRTKKEASSCSFVAKQVRKTSHLAYQLSLMSLNRSRRQIRRSTTLILHSLINRKLACRTTNQQKEKGVIWSTVQVLGLRPAEEEQFMSCAGFTMCRPSAEWAPGWFTATVEITALSAGWSLFSSHSRPLASVFGKYTSSSDYLLLSSLSFFSAPSLSVPVSTR